eukprot:3206676-Rhodomonas_salina.6
MASRAHRPGRGCNGKQRKATAFTSSFFMRLAAVSIRCTSSTSAWYPIPELSTKAVVLVCTTSESSGQHIAPGTPYTLASYCTLRSARVA